MVSEWWMPYWGGRNSARSMGLTNVKNGHRYLDVLVSLPQHSGRSGKAERSQPPPSAWTSVTAATMRRPRRFTALTSSERAALSAVVTSRYLVTAPLMLVTQSSRYL